MQVQNVLKTDSLENVINGKFVFCKELKKGFIKGELSSLGLSDYSFENVATVIESLTLEELETKGLNTVIFVNGEEKISQRANLDIEATIAEMENPTTEMIFSLLSDRRLKSDYFDTSFVQNIIDGGDTEAGSDVIENNLLVIFQQNNLLFSNRSEDIIDTEILDSSLVDKDFRIDVTFTTGNNLNIFLGIIGLHEGGNTKGILFQYNPNYDVIQIGIGNGSSSWSEIQHPLNTNTTYSYSIEFIDGVLKIYQDDEQVFEVETVFNPIDKTIKIGNSWRNRYFDGEINNVTISTRQR